MTARIFSMMISVQSSTIPTTVLSCESQITLTSRWSGILLSMGTESHGRWVQAQLTLTWKSVIGYRMKCHEVFTRTRFRRVAKSAWQSTRRHRREATASFVKNLSRLRRLSRWTMATAVGLFVKRLTWTCRWLMRSRSGSFESRLKVIQARVLLVRIAKSVQSTINIRIPTQHKFCTIKKKWQASSSRTMSTLHAEMRPKSRHFRPKSHWKRFRKWIAQKCCRVIRTISSSMIRQNDAHCRFHRNIIRFTTAGTLAGHVQTHRQECRRRSVAITQSTITFPIVSWRNLYKRKNRQLRPILKSRHRVS